MSRATALQLLPSSVLDSAWSPGPAASSRSADTLRAALGSLSGDAHVLHALEFPKPLGSLLLCVGASDRGTLFAVYTLIESLGARFYLSGDVLPPPRRELSLLSAFKFSEEQSSSSNAAAAFNFPEERSPPGNAAASFKFSEERSPPGGAAATFSLRNSPTFASRGLQPFHDFPMGPDWWSADMYKSIATSMSKLKMNVWGYHTYPPTSGAGPEPAVWIGTAGGFDGASGNVSEAAAYTSSWYLTQDFPRGNVPDTPAGGVATSAYCCGAAALYSRDCYGSPAQSAECWPSPETAASAAVLNDAGALLESAAAWAAGAGVATCLGSEIPLSGPPGGLSPNASTAELYEGLFGRLLAKTPSVGCFWLWTTESVEDHTTGKGLPQSNPLWAQLTAEIGVALAARDSVHPNLTVGTNGWCLGPGDNSSYFDKVIADPTFTLASIDGCLGWCDVDAGFGDIDRHAATVIPWMEDDIALAGAELWVQRTLDHAASAAQYGAEGLMGLLWRTWETTPQVAALAAAGWDLDGGGNNLSAASVYADFCAASFGADSNATCAALFLSVDGATQDGSYSPGLSRLPRSCQGCCGGPMYPDGQAQALNTSAWEAWLATVSGAANAERAARWVALFQYHSNMAEACIAGAALAAAAARVVDEATAREYGFPALAELSWAWEAMMSALLAFVTTPGELGVIAAQEGVNWPSNFLAAAAGPILPYLTSCAPYDGPAAACYADNYTTGAGRVLNYTVTLNSGGNSRESCASACVRAGYPYAGVEFGVACFCGAALPPPSDALPIDACAAMPCAGDAREACGGADIISVYPAACPPTPNLPPGLLPPTTYQGLPRLWINVVRTTAAASEGALSLEVTALAAAPPDSVVCTWWTLPGPSPNASVPLALLAQNRSIYAAALPLPQSDTLVLEYVVEATWAALGTTLVAPVEGAQTVVVI